MLRLTFAEVTRLCTLEFYRVAVAQSACVLSGSSDIHWQVFALTLNTHQAQFCRSVALKSLMR